MLNMTVVDLKLIPDPNMCTFFKNMRGGVSDISNRYSEANNMYLKSLEPKTRIRIYIFRHKQIMRLWNVKVSSNKWFQMDTSKRV